GPRLPREIGTDARPGMRAVDGLPDDVGRVVQQVRIHRRPDERHGAHVAAELVAARRGIGPHLRGLAGAAVVARHAAARTAEYDFGIARIWCGDAVFLNVRRMPVVERDFTVIRAT